jgi:hypothetical protein
MKKLLLIASAFIALTVNAQWNSQITLNATSRGINKINIVDKNTVWATLRDGSATAANIQEICKTVNGGTSWRVLKLGITSPGAINIANVSAVDTTTAWASVYPASGTSTKQGIYKTSNGGATWVKQTTATFTSASFVDGVHFFDANKGVAFGDPVSNEFEIYTTSNGGTNWTKVAGAKIPDPFSTDEYGYVGALDAVDSTIWFCTNLGRVYKSVNYGADWSVSSTPLTDINDVNFINANWGFIRQITTGRNSLAQTLDGGTTWDTIIHTGPLYTSGMDYVPAARGFLISTGAAQTLPNSTETGSGTSYSLDTGKTWIRIDTAAQRLEVNFFNDSIGWAGGFSGGPGTEGIFKWDPGFIGSPEGSPAVCIDSPDLTYTTGGSPYAISYSWTLSDNAAGTISGTGATATIDWNSTYTGYVEITVTGMSGSGSTQPSIPFGLNVNPLPTVFANASASTICGGSSVTLTGSGATTYSWDNGVTNGTPFTPSSTDTYIVYGTDDNGCVGTASATVTVNTPVTPVISQSNDTLYSDIMTGIQWYNNSVLISGATDYFYVPPFGGGTYTAVNTVGACSSAPSNGILITGIVKDKNTGAVKVSPNPNNGVFTIENIGNGERVTVQVTDVLGQTIYSSTGNFAGKKKIELNGINPGFYFVSVTEGTKSNITRIIVK